MTSLVVQPPRSLYFKGALLVAGAGLMWSTTGALMRFAPHLDAWQFLFYRCLGMCVVLVLLGQTRARPSFPRLAALGASEAIVALTLSVATTSFIFAIKSTSVANALFFNSCSPLLAALLGALILKERITATTLGAVALGLAGLTVMVAGEIDAGYLLGNVAALISALGFAVCTVCVRAAGPKNFDAAVIAYSLLCATVSLTATLAAGKPLIVPPLEGLAAFASGFAFMGAGFAMFMRGAPHMPAAGQTVLAQTETVFGPFWVWLLFGEVPLPTTLAGGAVILLAVLAMGLAGAREARPKTR